MRTGRFSLCLLVWVALAGPTGAAETLGPDAEPLFPGLVRSTPAAAFRGLLSSCTEEDFRRAAAFLDLSEIPVDRREEVAPDVAEKLCQILRRLSANAELVRWDTPEGPMESGVPTNAVVALRFHRSGISGEVVLQRMRDASGQGLVWAVDRRTVASVPFWFRVLVQGKAPQALAPINPGLPQEAKLSQGSPRESLLAFLEAASEGDFLLAASYLDLSTFAVDVQKTMGPLAARRLYLVLLRTDLVDPSRVSSEPAGLPEPGLPEDRERLGTLEVRGRKVDVLLADRYDPGVGHRWLFAPETVAELSILYKRYGFGWLGDHLPEMFFSVSFGGLAAWQWLALLLLLSLGYWLSARVGKGLSELFQRFVRHRRLVWVDLVVAALDGPLGLSLWSALLLFGGAYLGLFSTSPVPKVLVKLLALGATTWFFLRFLDRLCIHWSEQAQERHSLSFSFIPIFRRIGRVLLILLGLLASFHAMGIPVTTALAGLGIGGVAVAFAAQKTLENIFAALAIAADRPFAVGDTVQIGTLLGTVMDVGLRSTRLRTLERTFVTIPNATVVASEVVNLTARDRILFNPTLGLEYRTSKAQLSKILGEIRQLLADHPKVVKEGQRCVFRGFGDSALLVEIFCWLATTSWEEYLAVAEELNFALKDIVERAGTAFAFPSRTIYLTQEERRGAG
ncbi:MAG: mechanosensitive ion channel family protein [Thermoanaerobaculaceae bacterium]